MMGRRSGQLAMVFVDMESLIPTDHLLRKINRIIPFDIQQNQNAQMAAERSVSEGISGNCETMHSQRPCGWESHGCGRKLYSC